MFEVSSGGEFVRMTMESALDTVLLQAQARIGSLMMMDPQAHALRIVAARGFPTEIIEQIKKLALAPGQGIAGHVYQTGKPYYLRDAQSDPLFVPQTLPQRQHFQFLSLPVESVTGTILGVLNIHFPTEKLLNATELEDLRKLANDLILSEMDQQPTLPS